MSEQALQKSEEQRGKKIEILPVHFVRFESIDETKLFVRMLDDLYRNLLQKDVDYGILPGTDKPSMFKPGAELLARRIGLEASSRQEKEIVDRVDPYIQYDYLFEVFYEGQKIADGRGTCNSLEPKYALRWYYEREIPPKYKKEELEVRRTRNGSVQYGAPVSKYTTFGLANTIMKMALKRSYIDAILRATGASRIFSQDIEELIDNNIIDGGFEGNSVPTENGTAEKKNPPAAEGKAETRTSQQGNGNGSTKGVSDSQLSKIKEGLKGQKEKWGDYYVEYWMTKSPDLAKYLKGSIDYPLESLSIEQASKLLSGIIWKHLESDKEFQEWLKWRKEVGSN